MGDDPEMRVDTPLRQRHRPPETVLRHPEPGGDHRLVAFGKEKGEGPRDVGLPGHPGRDETLAGKRLIEQSARPLSFLA
ncbi:MAG: hypothetical protein DI556_13455 [Rhodovulum sulfidophilum]|uniref:Uncharacterized protein n=1 Tax=Rhodovulum sulfidophilum TaxID=35806 RepID=A0A2W5N5V8_RHOSU|nr:MAG: hypothetical protein DI556_13455 [Rhodovulum sulfidophilum]